MKNWKTTLAGVLAILVALATTMHWITAEVAAAVTTILVSFGLMAAKDKNVTGGTTPQ
jgi:hypothetical protein